MPVGKKDVPEGQNILFEGGSNAAVLVDTRAPRTDRLAPVYKSVVLDRMLGLEQPDVKTVLFTKLVWAYLLNLTL